MDDMGRKGEDTFNRKRRRMPYVAKIKREDPFRSADTREIEAMVKRIAAAGETFSIAGWRDEYRYRLFHFVAFDLAGAVPCLIGGALLAFRCIFHAIFCASSRLLWLDITGLVGAGAFVVLGLRLLSFLEIL
jgi:hypothetical protein